MSQNVKEQMKRAKALIAEKRYQEAYNIVITVDHPVARQWESKLEKLVDKKPPKSTSGNRQMMYIGGGLIALVILVLAVGVTVMLVNNNTSNNEQAVANIATKVIDATATPLPEPTSQWTYANTLDNPLPADQPTEYDVGTLQILEVHSPVGVALYSSSNSNRVALMNNDEYVGIKFAFQCHSVCDTPPGASLSLITSDGNRWGIASAFALMEEMMYANDDNVGWLYFHVESESSLSALHITNAETSLFVSLPNPTNGYFVETSWKTLGDDSQSLRIPELRRLLDSQYPVDDVIIGATGDIKAVLMNIVLDTLYFESNQQVIDIAFPIISVVSGRWNNYREDVDYLKIIFRRSTDDNVTATVIIESPTLGDYADGSISTNTLINTASIEIRESRPTLGLSESNQQTSDESVTPPTPTPNSSAQTTTSNSSVPQTSEGFEQYIRANYSSIGGQPLSIENVVISDDPARYVSIVLPRDSNGWETFADQTRSVATDYAERLMQDAESFFGRDEDMLVSVSYSYYAEELQDYHYDDDWWYIGDYKSGKGWYVSQDFVRAFFYDGSWSLDVWNYK